MDSIDKCQLTAQSKVNQDKHLNSLVSKRTFIFVFILCSAIFLYAQPPIYLDSSKSIKQQVDDLLGRMTLEE